MLNLIKGLPQRGKGKTSLYFWMLQKSRKMSVPPRTFGSMEIADMTYSPGLSNALNRRVVASVRVGRVWSGHPVGMALLTSSYFQYVAYYDGQRRLTVAKRRLDKRDWVHQVLPRRTGWDSHNYITMAFDPIGHLHIAADMHVSPLVYFRTAESGNIRSLRRFEAMVGDREQRCTYPVFLVSADGALLFTYRDGGSGDGGQIYNRYNAELRQWTRLLDGPLLDGEGLRNAYATAPYRGPDGRFHMAWVWRDTPDASANHHVSYARSQDLLRWEAADGRELTLPITLENGDVVDPVLPGGGTINNNICVGFDPECRPVVTYHKHDENGFTQVYNARFESDCWVSHRASNWDYRWDFGGLGTIDFHIRVAPIRRINEGLSVQSYEHRVYGSGCWEIDPATLEVRGPYISPGGCIEAGGWHVPRSDFPGMSVRFASDLGGHEETAMKGKDYVLRWEALAANRDRAREGPLPEPSCLEVLEIE